MLVLKFKRVTARCIQLSACNKLVMNRCADLCKGRRLAVCWSGAFRCVFNTSPGGKRHQLWSQQLLLSLSLKKAIFKQFLSAIIQWGRLFTNRKYSSELSTFTPRSDDAVLRVIAWKLRATLQILQLSVNMGKVKVHDGCSCLKGHPGLSEDTHKVWHMTGDGWWGFVVLPVYHRDIQ